MKSGSKTLASMMMERNKKFQGGRNEQEVQHILEQLGLEYEFQPKIKTEIGLTFNPDFRISGTNILLHADGEHYHNHSQTQREKDDWKDRAYNEVGFRNLHIPGALLVAEGCEKMKPWQWGASKDHRCFHAWVAFAITQFLFSKEWNEAILA